MYKLIIIIIDSSFSALFLWNLNQFLFLPGNLTNRSPLRARCWQDGTLQSLGWSLFWHGRCDDPIRYEWIHGKAPGSEWNTCEWSGLQLNGWDWTRSSLGTRKSTIYIYISIIIYIYRTDIICMFLQAWVRFTPICVHLNWEHDHKPWDLSGLLEVGRLSVFFSVIGPTSCSWHLDLDIGPLDQFGISWEFVTFRDVSIVSWFWCPHHVSPSEPSAHASTRFLRHTVAKLIGSPPGYVGYDEESQLTNPVSRLQTVRDQKRNDGWKGPKRWDFCGICRIL